MSGDTARLYHRLSSYSFIPYDQWPVDAMPPPLDHPLVVQDFVPMEPSRLPPDRKVYEPGLPVTQLTLRT